MICYKMLACDSMQRSACFLQPLAMEPVIRKDFPETWIWDSIADGRFIF